MRVEPIATGKVEWLSVNGEPVRYIEFTAVGPVGDRHVGMLRPLSSHDGEYMRTSDLVRGETVFNWRTFTALAAEELTLIELQLGGLAIPQGCLLENLVFSGIPKFSQLPPTTRLVFPRKSGRKQAVLTVWEENEPCSGVGKRLEEHYGIEHLSSRFIAAAQHKRGVMGFVLAPGDVDVGDPVYVYPPVGC